MLAEEVSVKSEEFQTKPFNWIAYRNGAYYIIIVEKACSLVSDFRKEGFQGFDKKQITTFRLNHFADV